MSIRYNSSPYVIYRVLFDSSDRILVCASSEDDAYRIADHLGNGRNIIHVGAYFCPYPLYVSFHDLDISEQPISYDQYLGNV